jgi:hypothetical protein
MAVKRFRLLCKAQCMPPTFIDVNKTIQLLCLAYMGDQSLHKWHIKAPEASIFDTAIGNASSPVAGIKEANH